MLEEAMAANLTMKQGLTELALIFPRSSEVTIDNDCKHDEDVLEDLKPHSNLRRLEIRNYKGEKLPSWASRGQLCITLKCLVEIELYDCSYCEHVPVFSQLRSLECLKIWYMNRVEYMEEDGVCDTSPSSSKSQGMQTPFFPSLKQLWLIRMKNLKGWWKGVEAIETSSSSELVGAGQHYNDHQLSMQFCELSELRIENCPELKHMPNCPKVEDLILCSTNERLSVVKMATTSASASASYSGKEMAERKLKKLTINNMEHQLVSLPKQCLHQLSELTVSGDDKLVNTKSVGEVFATLSSLRCLNILECDKLRSISQGLEHLTALNRLSIAHCSELEQLSINEEATTTAINTNDEIMMPWKAFEANLRYLSLEGLPKMTGLPRGLQHLTNLRWLTLRNNSELREIPDWMSGLSTCPLLKNCICIIVKT